MFVRAHQNQWNENKLLEKSLSFEASELVKKQNI